MSQPDDVAPGVLPPGTRVRCTPGTVPSYVGNSGTVVAVGPKFTRIAFALDSVADRRVANDKVTLDGVWRLLHRWPQHPLDAGPPGRGGPVRSLGHEWPGGFTRTVDSLMPYWQWLGWTVQQHLEYAGGARSLEGPPIAAPNRLVIVGCGHKKAVDRGRRDAGLMYTGPYHLACRRAAAAWGGHVSILSAKYGLLELEDVIAAYDLRIGQPGSVTVEQLRWQAHQYGLLNCSDVTVFAGKDYAHLVRQVWPHAFAPLTATKSQGEQHALLAKITRMFTDPPAGPVDA